MNAFNRFHNHSLIITSIRLITPSYHVYRRFGQQYFVILCLALYFSFSNCWVWRIVKIVLIKEWTILIAKMTEFCVNDYQVWSNFCQWNKYCLQMKNIQLKQIKLVFIFKLNYFKITSMIFYKENFVFI
jgi:hypothetical protein